MSSSLRKLEEALAEYYGWAITPSARLKLSAAIAAKAGRLQIAPEEYCDIAANSQSEMLALVEEAAVGDTAFFRESAQFEWLRSVVLPKLGASRPRSEVVRLWSSACSTGEEAYSLAIAWHQSNAQQYANQVEIFATDVRNRALLVASQARYEEASLSAIEAGVRSQYFVPCEGASDAMATDATGSRYTLSPGVRRLVTFRRVNLLEQIFWKSMAGRFDLIVCTNLLFLLHSVAVRRMVGRLAHSLKPDGFLMVAPSEVGFVNHPKLRRAIDAPTFFCRIA